MESDSFINYWFSKWRKPKATGPYISLFGKGELTMKQPIFHSDLATGIMNSLHDPEAVGQTYEAMGPQRLTQRDLITYMFDCATRNKELGNFGIKELMLDPKTLLKSYVFEQMPLFGQVNVLHGNTLDRLCHSVKKGLPNRGVKKKGCLLFFPQASTKEAAPYLLNIDPFQLGPSYLLARQ